MKNLLKTMAYCLLTAAVLAFTACEENGKKEDNNWLLMLLLRGANGGTTVAGSGTSAGGDTVVNIAAIPGVAVPVIGEIPVSAITETAQYTGTVTWDGGWAWSTRFGGNKAYTATITLTAKTGYTLTGVSEDFFTVAGVSSATNSTDSGVVTVVFPATATVAIGDAVLGGKVGYILQSGDTGYVAGEQRGLIAASADQGAGIQWAVTGYQGTGVPDGTATELGTGSANTDNIIAQNGAGTTYAAGLCRAYKGGGYTDWYLPSKDELYKLYINRVAIGGFFSSSTSDSYWQSTEASWTNAYYLYFPTGAWGGSTKADGRRVRAVRAF